MLQHQVRFAVYGDVHAVLTSEIRQALPSWPPCNTQGAGSAVRSMQVVRCINSAKMACGAEPSPR
ncbi:MAG: hypothetical protein QM757_09470 [Paludibaculum sp.]